MVFDNLGDTSYTGVAFTRDPSTGENYFYGEYLPNAQVRRRAARGKGAKTRAGGGVSPARPG